MKARPVRGAARVLVMVGSGLSAAGLGSCTPARSAPEPPLPKAAPVVVVTMREHLYEYDPATIPAGRVVFRFVNAGKVDHFPALLRLPEDLPPLLEQVRGTQRRSIQPYAGVYIRKPGQTGSFAVDLVPGQRYGLVCYATDPDGSSHSRKGMVSEFRPPKPTGQPSAPPK